MSNNIITHIYPNFNLLKVSIMNKDTLQNISDIIKDIISTDFIFNKNCINVPHPDDQDLTFESGETKKGKIIETCVLFVDIRNSVELNKRYSIEDMGKLYTAFVKSSILCSEYHHGSVRNIIGDRVMIVFPPKNCFTNAVNCAISINTISIKILKTYCPEFKCGIGIDFGKMYVSKIGTIKHGQEANTYKNLIWIGRPANIASRLTDIANKELKEDVFIVTQKPRNPKAYKHNMVGSGLLQYSPVPYSLLGPTQRVPYEPLYLDTEETMEMTALEFSKSIYQNNISGTINTAIGKVVRFEKTKKSLLYKAILMTEDVYRGFIKETQNNATRIINSLHEIECSIRDYEGKIWGGDIYWSVVNKFRI